MIANLELVSESALFQKLEMEMESVSPIRNVADGESVSESPRMPDPFF